jgi:O-antigen/teichoic acid export membrane protein
MSKLRTGIIVTSLLSVISLPLTYLGNWLLSLFGSDTVANYAIILLVSNIVSTFFLYGASTVYSIYLPKLASQSDRLSFIVSSSIISGILFISGGLLVVLIPDSLFTVIVIDGDINSTLVSIIIFSIIFATGQIIMYSLIGLQEYKISAILNTTQPFILAIILIVVLAFGYKDQFNNSSLQYLILICTFIWVLNIIVGLKEVINDKPNSNIRWYLPTGFWKQSGFIHFGTILTFIYGYVDQILVLGFLGKKELATYFLTMQVARLVIFFSRRLQQVFQSTFADEIGRMENNGFTLNKLYSSISKYNIFTSFFISIVLIYFGIEIMQVFENSIDFKIEYLVLLVSSFFAASLGGINSTIIQAKEKNDVFLINNIIVVAIQLILSIILVKSHGIIGVIIARFFSVIIGQLGLTYILKKACDIQFYQPFRFIILNLFIITSSFAVSYFNIALIVKTGICIILVAICLVMMRIKIYELTHLLSNRRI